MIEEPSKQQFMNQPQQQEEKYVELNGNKIHVKTWVQSGPNANLANELCEYLLTCEPWPINPNDTDTSILNIGVAAGMQGLRIEDFSPDAIIALSKKGPKDWTVFRFGIYDNVSWDEKGELLPPESDAIQGVWGTDSDCHQYIFITGKGVGGGFMLQQA